MRRSAAHLGTKPIDLVPGIDYDLLAKEVTATWGMIVEAIRPHLKGDSRADSVVSSPTVGAARAVVRHYNPSVTDNRNGWSFWQIDNGASTRTSLLSIRPLSTEH